jgi:hypothetical protein
MKGKLMEQQVDETTSRCNKLMKQQVDETAFLRKGMLIKLQIDEIAS